MTEGLSDIRFIYCYEFPKRMSSHLETLIAHQQRNVKKIESIREGEYGKGIEGWYLRNEELEGVILDEIREQAISLYEEGETLLLQCQINAFNSYEQVKEFNERHGKTFVQYDPKIGFVDNCRKGFKPFPDGPVLYLFSDAEDEIAKEAIKQFESNHLIPILTRLNTLYDRVIGFLKESESPE